MDVILLEQWTDVIKEIESPRFRYPWFYTLEELVQHPETTRLIKRLALFDSNQFSLLRRTLENGGYRPGDIPLEIFGSLKAVFFVRDDGRKHWFIHDSCFYLVKFENMTPPCGEDVWGFHTDRRQKPGKRTRKDCQSSRIVLSQEAMGFGHVTHT